MLHHQIHFLVSLGRQIVHLYNHAERVVELGFMRLRNIPCRGSAGKRAVAEWQKPPLLLHYHIFKNAGTSFEWTLEQAFGKGLHKYDGTVAGEVLSSADIANFVSKTPEAKVICSHQATMPPPKIRGREVISSILIRDPIARIRSIYAFERRQNVYSPGALKAKELDFKGYVEWRLNTSPAMLCNFQVYFCSRTNRTSRMDVSHETLLRKAIDNLDQVNLVGTVARYNEWLALVQVVLSRMFPGTSLMVSRQNVTDMKSDATTEKNILDSLVRELGQSLADHLLQANELDMSLHQIADALLTRRLAEYGVDVALRNAYANARERYRPRSPIVFPKSRSCAQRRTLTVSLQQ